MGGRGGNVVHESGVRRRWEGEGKEEKETDGERRT